MAESFTGQIQVFAFGFAPRLWLICDGSILQIRQNTALFSLLGTAYGGNGTTTFGIPNLLGRATYGAGGSTPVGNTTGSSTVTLIQPQMAGHTHNLAGTATLGTLTTAANNAFATTAVSGKGGQSSGFNRYSTSGAKTPMAQTSLGMAGGNQPHNNMQPYLGMNYYICTAGVFPSRP